MSDDDFPSLRGLASGRRSDDAFVGAVVNDVRALRRARRPGRWLWVPAFAVLAVVALAPRGPALISAQTWQALADDELIINVDVDVDALDEPTLLALVGSDADSESLFALSGLDGSTDRELLDVEEALDRALSL